MVLLGNPVIAVTSGRRSKASEWFIAAFLDQKAQKEGWAEVGAGKPAERPRGYGGVKVTR